METVMNSPHRNAMARMRPTPPETDEPWTFLWDDCDLSATIAKFHNSTKLTKGNTYPDYANPNGTNDADCLLKCVICSHNMPSAYDLAVHMRSHAGEKPYVCIECNKRFGTANLLHIHMRDHNVAKPFHCGECGKRYTCDSLLAAHERKHHQSDSDMISSSDDGNGAPSFSCVICAADCSSLSELQTHMRNHTDEHPYVCDTCNKRFLLKSHLRIHMHTCEKTHQCNLCDSRFLTASNLQTHMNEHTGEKPHRCDICSQRYSDPAELRQHIKTHVMNKTMQCDLCDKRFAFAWLLQRHRLTHMENGHAHENEIYGDDYEDNDISGVPKDDVEDSLSPVAYTNSVEMMDASTYQEPSAHQSVVVTNKMPVNPPILQTTTAIPQPSEVVVGPPVSKKEAEEKPFACTKCSKRFSLAYYLRLHDRTHTGEKPYPCPLCGKTFSQRSSQQRHMKVHAKQ